MLRSKPGSKVNPESPVYYVDTIYNDLISLFIVSVQEGDARMSIEPDVKHTMQILCAASGKRSSAWHGDDI